MSLQQKLRAFAQLELGGVIPWENFKFPDIENSDTTRCVIEGRKGEYRLAVTSPYSAPPLGKVEFTAEGFELSEANQDAAWHKIAEYLKARERGEEPVIAQEVVAAKVAMPENSSVIPFNPLSIPDRVYVYYWAEPGAWYQNGPALVTGVNRDGTYDLTVFPKGSEPVHRERVGRKSDKLANVCWEEYPSADAVSMPQSSNVDALRQRVEEMMAQVAELRERRGPGRPPSKVA